MPCNYVAESFHTKELCSRLSSTVHFSTKNGHFVFLSPLWGYVSFCHNSCVWETDRWMEELLMGRVQLQHGINYFKVINSRIARSVIKICTTAWTKYAWTVCMRTNSDIRSAIIKTSFTSSVLTRSTHGDHWSNLRYIVVRLLSKDNNGLIGAENHLKHNVTQSTCSSI